MNISTMIADAAIQYPKSKNGPFAGAPIGQVIKEEIPEALRNKLSLTDYVIKGSIGNGNFASIPWIAIMDKEITTSTRKWFYIVFLFSSDGQRIYLTLNQGITYFDEKKYKRPKVKEISNKIYETFPSSTPLKMDIELNSNTPLGTGYESTTISAFEYDTSNMPSEEKLLSDLSSLLDDYSELKQFFVDNDNDLEKFYSAIIGNGTSDKYKEFKYLLSRFVEQANSNLQNKNNRKTSLGIEGFEDNNFRHSTRYDQLTIDGVEYHVHLFSTGSYGPNNGEGSTMVPYICHRLANENWSNIRVTFQNSHMTSLRLVEWNQNSKTNKERNISFFVDDLDLFSNAEPNDNLINYTKNLYLLKSRRKT